MWRSISLVNFSHGIWVSNVSLLTFERRPHTWQFCQRSWRPEWRMPKDSLWKHLLLSVLPCWSFNDVVRLLLTALTKASSHHFAAAAVVVAHCTLNWCRWCHPLPPLMTLTDHNDGLMMTTCLCLWVTTTLSSKLQKWLLHFGHLFNGIRSRTWRYK